MVLIIKHLFPMNMKEGAFTEQQVLELARQAYEAGNPQFYIVPTKCALLVIDMQDEFVKPHWSPYWVPEATRQVPRIKKLIEHCRKQVIPVIYTVYSDTYGDLDRPRTLSLMPNRFPELDIDQSAYFRKGQVWHELAPKKGDIVLSKSSYGAFYETPLATILKNLERDTVIICGTLTNYCCSTTARQAYERSLKVIVGSDITSSHFPELHETELKVLRRGFAMVLTADEIIQQL
jgi:nicotinamidase-related amidase